MIQNQNQNYRQEEAMFDNLGDMITGGWHRPVRVMINILIKAKAMSLMIFIRKRLGVTMFSFSLLFFGGVFDAFSTMISQENWRYLVHRNMTEGHGYSGGIIMIFSSICFWLFLARWASSSWSIRSKNPRRIRHNLSVGESILYPLVARLLHPLKIVEDYRSPSFWKINEDRWTQYYEPLLIILGGIYAKSIGYTLLGNYIIIAACCLFNYPNTDVV